jgi:uncharacterized protein (TIGR00290 family)
MDVIVLWSGGKDSCLACYRAQKQGHRVIALINFLSPDNIKSLSHGLPATIIKYQAELIGLSLIQRVVPQGTYEQHLKSLISECKQKGAEGVVFGDIYLQEHRQWLDRVCKEAAIEPIYPLWKLDTKQLVNDFIEAGFRSMLVSVREDCLSQEWLGRVIDKDFMKDLPRGIDPCGEAGEFHTFVLSGPMFSKSITIKSFKKANYDKHWFLDIESWE